MSHHYRPVAGVWQLIWSLNGSQRIHAFVWLVHRDRLLTNKLNVARALGKNDTCTACGLFKETVLRSLRDCPRVRAMWEEIVQRARTINILL